MSNSAYCDNDDIADVMSSNGMRLASEDTGLSHLPDQDHIDSCIAKASQRIDMYLVKRYDLTTIGNHRWVVECAAVLASVCLMRRRGRPVPASLQERVSEMMGELSNVSTGAMLLDGVAPRATEIPSMSNMRVDMRYRTAKTRVERPISTGREKSDVMRYPDTDEIGFS